MKAILVNADLCSNPSSGDTMIIGRARGVEIRFPLSLWIMTKKSLLIKPGARSHSAKLVPVSESSQRRVPIGGNQGSHQTDQKDIRQEIEPGMLNYRHCPIEQRVNHTQLGHRN